MQKQYIQALGLSTGFVTLFSREWEFSGDGQFPYVQNNIPRGIEDFHCVQSNFSNGQRDFPPGMDNFPQGIKDFPYVQSNIPKGIEDFPYGKTVNPSVGQGWEVVEKYISSQNCAGCDQ